MSGPTFREPASYDWPARVADLNAPLRLKTAITGMKLFERVEDMEACRAVIGLAPQDETFRGGREFVGIWHATPEDARAGRVSVYKAQAPS